MTETAASRLVIGMPMQRCLIAFEGGGTLDFDEIDTVYEQAQPAMDQFEEELRRLLGL